jgi:hypothetical protein
MEGLLPKLHGADAVEIPGARALLHDLIVRDAPWAIVTSGTVPLVKGVRASSHPVYLFSFPLFITCFPFFPPRKRKRKTGPRNSY